jgi:hypothetical protein
LTVKDLQPAHPGTLAEVREKVSADLRREKAVESAKARAAELSARGQSGEGLAAAAKALGLEVKTSEPFVRTGTVPGVGSARPLSAAFGLAVGQTGPAAFLGANWVVYRVVAREESKPEELEKRRKEVEEQVLQSKRTLAYQVFRSALEDRMKREGKLKLNPENIKRLSSPT